MVEMKELCQDDWKPCSKFVEDTNYRVPGLRENHKYLFRVFAESVHGKVGEALEIDGAVVARNPFSKMSSTVWFRIYTLYEVYQVCQANVLAQFDITRMKRTDKCNFSYFLDKCNFSYFLY